jgi:hypothetical protein
MRAYLLSSPFTNLDCDLGEVGCINEGLFTYKVTRVLKEDAGYSTWVDIMRAKGYLPRFNDLVDQAREFLAAEFVQEQQMLPVSGALKASTLPSMPARTPVKYQYCGYSHHEKADCRFYKRDLE